jgi:hypothetical protein
MKYSYYEKKMKHDERLAALDEYMNSDAFEASIERMIAEDNKKHEQNITFSKTDDFQNILKFIKNKKSQSLSDSDKFYHPDEIPFHKDTIYLFFSSCSAACVFSVSDDYEDFSTHISYLGDYILSSVNGQGTIESVSYIPNGDFNLHLNKEDYKHLSSSGWTFGKENGFYFAKNELLKKSFYNKYFTFVKKYMYRIDQLETKLQNSEFISELGNFGYSIISKNPIVLLHIETNNPIMNEDATWVLHNIKVN